MPFHTFANRWSVARYFKEHPPQGECSVLFFEHHNPGTTVRRATLWESARCRRYWIDVWG